MPVTVETDQAQDVKRIQKLNNLFFAHMCGKDPHDDADEMTTAPSKPASTGFQKSAAGDQPKTTSEGDMHTELAAAAVSAVGAGLGVVIKKKRRR